MTKLFAIFACLVFTLGIVVASMGHINSSIVKTGGLRDKTVNWIENSLVSPNEGE